MRKKSEEGSSGKPYQKRESTEGKHPYSSDRPAYKKRTESNTDEKKRYSPNKREDSFKRSDKPSERSGDVKPERRNWKDKGDDRDAKPFSKRDSFDKPSRPFPKKDRDGKPAYNREDRPKRDDRDAKPFAKRDSYDKPSRPFPKKDRDDKPAYNREDRPKRDDRDSKPFAKRDSFDKPARPFPKKDRDDKPSYNREDRPKRDDRDAKPFSKKPFPKKEAEESGIPAFKHRDNDKYERVNTEESSFRKKNEGKEIDAPMTLNKYISHSGECSRRAAGEIVKQGKVRVNGDLVLEPGYRVQPGDTVTLSGKKLTPQKDLVYILLNKPKDFITTNDDPEGRKTVMDLVDSAEVGRLFPIGRLDRNTTGLLLMTNDGALAQKLSHPSYNIKKVYQVSLDKKLTKVDYQKIAKGIELEDGLVNVDEIAYLDEQHELGIEIHNGKNRIVRRIFESLGYQVEKLDRVMYAGLTKKNLARGKWRFLDEKEIILLKHFKS